MALPRSALLAALLLDACTATPGGTYLGADTLLARYDWQHPVERCTLPDALEEASGLTDDGAGGLLSHSDNDSTIYRIGCDAPPAAITTGQPLKGDFEGLARDGDRLLLLTSPGVVYAARLDESHQRVDEPPAAMASPAAGRCGFEGIEVAWDHDLVLACKYPREPQPGIIVLFRMTLAGTALQSLRVDVGAVQQNLRLRRLRPSGLAFAADAGHLLVLVGKERVLLELGRSGELLGWQPLAARLHRQAEGLALLPDGRLAIVDEADGRRATLTIYAPPSGT